MNVSRGTSVRLTRDQRALLEAADRGAVRFGKHVFSLRTVRSLSRRNLIALTGPSSDARWTPTEAGKAALR